MKVVALIVFFLSSGWIIAQDSRDLRADSLIAFAKKQLGTPYRYATSNPGVSFDCSGFASYVYSNFDITKCRTSKGYGDLGEFVERDEACAGDAILFSNTSPGSKVIGHVGIVVSNDENGITFIHCASSKRNGGVIISHLDSAWYAQRFIGIRRLF